MITKQAQAVWRGGIKDGNGSFSAGPIKGKYSYASRFENGEGSTPEELVGAAHASCFSMALSLFLGERGHPPQAIRTTATVQLDPTQLAITAIALETEGEVSGLTEAEFRDLAEQANKNCPISKALGAVPITLKSARLAAATAGRA